MISSTLLSGIFTSPSSPSITGTCISSTSGGYAAVVGEPAAGVFVLVVTDEMVNMAA